MAKKEQILTEEDIVTGQDVNKLLEPSEFYKDGTRPELPKKKRVYIVGFAPSWKETPWEDTEAEFWLLNEFYKVLEMDKCTKARCDRWFEIHNPDSPSKSVPEHHKFLAECPVPLYMQKKDARFPNSVKFPLEEMFEFFKGKVGAKYFTNQISYMIAFAIMEGFEEIYVYGVDMAQDSEYQSQRPSCEYWIGLAEGMGRKVFIPSTSDLIKSNGLYAYDTDNQMRVKMKNRKKELGERMKKMQTEMSQHQQAINQLNANINACAGAKEDCDFWLKNWVY